MPAPKKNQPTAKQIASSSSSKPTSLNLDNDGDFLPDLIKEINKEAGSKILFNLGANDAPTIVHRWISTGSKQLDYIIGNLPGVGGGLPEGRIIEIQGPTGCHGKGDKVLMFDGTTKSIEEVQIGDKLMGPDSSSRTVLNLHRGLDDMYLLKQKRGGKSYQVTANHTLALLNTKNHTKEQITVKDFLANSKEYRRFRLQYRVPVTFQNKENQLPIKPYVLGLLIGDGALAKKRIELTTADLEIKNEYVDFCKSFGFEVKIHAKNNSKAFGLYHKNGFKAQETIAKDNDQIRTSLRELELLGTKSNNKFIPQIYKTSSLLERKELLAGLIDTDGHLSKQNNYEFTSKSLTLVNDFVFVARSCGFNCSEPKLKLVKGKEYWRTHLSGEIADLPVRLPRKKSARNSTQERTTRIELTPLGKQEYFGVTVDKDNLYLTDDTTVFRNCGKSHVMFEIAKATQRLGGLVIYVDTENATSIDNLEKIGINVKKRFAFAQTSCTEDIFGLIEKTILKARTMAADIPVTVIWDSVANSSPKAELEGEYDQNTIGLQARVLGKGLRKITNIIAGQHVLLVCCQQQREKIGVMYGDPCVSPETKIFVRRKSTRG